MTTEIYESPVDILNGLWKPFGKNVSRFLARMGDRALPVIGRVQADEARQVYDAVFQQFGEKASDIFGSSNANVLEDGLGVWIAWKDDATLNKAVEIAADYGISLDPDSPNIIEPLGLRNSQTPYEIPGVDASKYSGTRGSRMNTGAGLVGDTFDSIMGALFYDRNWTPEDTTHPSEMYMNLLDSAVGASSPDFINWFESVMDMWMGESSDMRQQFFYDLLASNPDAWADWIHECIYPPGERPSDTVTIVPDGEVEEEPEEEPVVTRIDPKPEGEYPDDTPMDPHPDGPQPDWHGGHTRPAPPKREGSPQETHTWPGGGLARLLGEDVPHTRGVGDFRHPLDPEGWEKAGLGFLTMFTPAAVEEWLMDRYNKARRKERGELGVHTQWDPEGGWDNYWDNKWATQMRAYENRMADSRRNQ